MPKRTRTTSLPRITSPDLDTVRDRFRRTVEEADKRADQLLERIRTRLAEQEAGTR